MIYFIAISIKKNYFSKKTFSSLYIYAMNNNFTSIIAFKLLLVLFIFTY